MNMKKIFTVLIFCLLATTVFAQVLTNDGKLWTNMTQNQKQAFIIGYLTALDMVRSMQTYFVENYEMVDEISVYINNLNDWALYNDVYASDIVDMLDYMYTNKNFINYPIYEIILLYYEKQWWSIE